MRRPFLPTLLLVATTFSVLEHAYGAPVVNPGQISSVVRVIDSGRRLDQPTQYQTTHTTQTALGLVTETCDIRLTPFVAEDGCDLVREDRKCLIQFVPNGAANSINGNNGGNANNGNNTGTSGSLTNGASSSGQNGATIVGSGTTDASATTTAASSISTDGSNGSSVTSSTAPPGATNSGQSSGAVANDNSPTPTSSSGVPSGSLTSTSSAAPDSSPSNFTLPGTQLSVLPIGLGVFAGVSVIALIVVGLVTYERTKYRKAFRQRKLAEQGGAPGMSERPTLT